MSKKIKITCTEEQANVISEAMNLYMRILMGQLENIPWELFKHGRTFDADAMRTTMKDAVKIAFPEMVGFYYGIYQPQVHEDARIAYDIHQSIRYTLSWHNHPCGGLTRDFNKVMQTSKEEIPSVEIIEE
jgi:hypothetical protein